MEILHGAMEILHGAMEIRERISAWSYPQVIFCDFEHIENRVFKEPHPVGGFAWVFLHYVDGNWLGLYYSKV